MDNRVKTLIRYEWKSFIRNKFQLLLLCITFGFGIYGIYYGNAEIEAQRETIRIVTALEESEFAQYRASFDNTNSSPDLEQIHDIAAQPSFAWFRHGYHAIIHPHDYASLAIGQRDLFRYYYRLTGMSLHYQLFENELANPVNLMAGNFDLSFVIIYLFPLIIIAFCYGLFSSEKENGTLPLLQIQTMSIQKITLIRLGFYFVIITGLALLISFLGLLYSGNVLAQGNLLAALVWLLAVLVYCSFWFGLLFLIIGLRKNSAFNAISAAGCWIFLLIIIPSVLNVLVTVKYPLNSSTLAGLTRRTGLENENDQEESREVIREFLAYRPDLEGTDSLIQNNLMPKAYAAYTTLKGMESQKVVDDYNEQVERRSKWTSKFHWLSPSVSLQEVFSQTTETDLATLVRFQNALSDFHGEITDFYFTRLFWDKPILEKDYDNLPQFSMPQTADKWRPILTSLAGVSLYTICLFSVGLIQMRRRIEGVK
ncbi:ABC-2 type transport system permease protein [Roseivirga ehrenbergii]|uniref:ABC transporter permease n=1 Tax=Roseivirga ehrenbergii (strain DSM 102268 / JCM 13514 / KCTC 12282 / NCIMB 14502 / KMM 6017) TaxID=279360 RepID=A0A150XSX9_ROSEK|nr:DUF3526 domain-containing protein [Roseivirga ehrenbergii]KYG81715.1 hypothetical protein MB14_14135 [Roseivirga ehrenbergii]TCL10893.1 ABC-2 type transport system permease protein [Roseivirga ehrenbergii]